MTASDDTVGSFFSQEPLVANESDLTSYSVNSFILLHIYFFSVTVMKITSVICNIWDQSKGEAFPRMMG